ncbi:ATP-dependent endonuclease [Dysgonomonas sp. 520]|uniref:ATP-dependent nuclease n=1 Tax=Dysgonomonas sp. 520 TaxID=2302931 RepID=UPI0013D60835|nr:AAA family ATPase [Dysgonomonas sp. 520]NDW08465.1 hypothetical protein [Dysgonomonas sp. 520]
MKLTEIEIHDFKSIKKANLIINNNQLCFVGKNECGKSSVIQAISYLNLFDTELNSNHLNKSSKSYLAGGYPFISGLFNISPNSYIALKELVEKNCKEKNFMEYVERMPSTSTNSLLQVKRWGNGLSNMSLQLTDAESYNIPNILDIVSNKPEFLEQFNLSAYPAIEYYENEELLLEPASLEELLGTDKKYETFRRLLYISGCENIELLDIDDHNRYATLISKFEDNFNEILKKHYKQDESISIKLQTARNEKLTLIIQDNSKNSFAIEERSPGFRYYFSFLVNKLYSKVKNGEKKTILLLDEPGNNLHPQGAKDLLISFNDIADNSQLLYTTHNPFLVIRNNIDSLYFIDKTSTKGTTISNKPYLNKYQILRKELGILLNDSFLIGDINLVVEGNTEKLAFHRLFQTEKYHSLEWLNIYNADGVCNISQTLNYLGSNNLNLSGIVITDSDKEAVKEREKKGYKKTVDGKKWIGIEINEAFPSNNTERTFEDLFPQQLYIDSFNEYCHGLKNLDVFDKKYEDYKYENEIITPIIDVMDTHFHKFINGENKKERSISKQDVIRILLDKIEGLDSVHRDEALKHCYKLIDKILISFKKIEKNATN